MIVLGRGLLLFSFFLSVPYSYYRAAFYPPISPALSSTCFHCSCGPLPFLAARLHPPAGSWPTFQIWIEPASPPSLFPPYYTTGPNYGGPVDAENFLCFLLQLFWSFFLIQISGRESKGFYSQFVFAPRTPSVQQFFRRHRILVSALGLDEEGLIILAPLLVIQALRRDRYNAMVL